jgi:hypothetical protein
VETTASLASVETETRTKATEEDMEEETTVQKEEASEAAEEEVVEVAVVATETEITRRTETPTIKVVDMTMVDTRRDSMTATRA